MWTKVGNDIIAVGIPLRGNTAKRTLKGLVESKMSGETYANYFKAYFEVYKYTD